MTGLIDQIDAALARTGLSDAAASRLAAGNASLIKNIRAGAGNVGFDSLRKLADVLDLEVYFGPKRHELPPGFAEAEADAVAMVKAATLNDGYMVLPWHNDARRPGPTPVAFSRSWMQRQSLEPDTLCLVVPDRVRLPGGGTPAGAVALIDTAAPRTASPAAWAYLDRTRVCLADVMRHGTVTLIRSGLRTEADLLLQGPESAAIRFLGRVLWWGTTEPVPPSDK